ncbi:hypothetical protein HPSA50_1849 [Helicobacter pylori SouthAfrica50]|uniref:Uncharacterized protein n=1 Tax=Helicobacter pylori SouthAfrica50 TaxID=1352357 RepID=T2SA73_HELPX|nr:hypothetical protein HPSA50_1849 [Helicobacter pylori SouthAfrica50]
MVGGFLFGVALYPKPQSSKFLQRQPAIKQPKIIFALVWL